MDISINALEAAAYKMLKNSLEVTMNNMVSLQVAIVF